VEGTEEACGVRDGRALAYPRKEVNMMDDQVKNLVMLAISIAGLVTSWARVLTYARRLGLF
jgi:hypothetical protein